MKSTPDEPRLYVIVREDLTFKFIQGTHGLAQFALEHPEEFKQWNNQTIVFLSVFNGLALDELAIELAQHDVKFSVFTEPDLKSELPTAICLFDDGTNGYRYYLKGLSLAKN